MDTEELRNEAFDFAKDILIIIVIVLFIKFFLVSPFQIKGQSMYDNYYDKQFIIVDKFSYLSFFNIKKGLPTRGDVVVFKPHVNPEKEFFIKRIIGIPGDTLKIEDGDVYLKIEGQTNFVKLKENYLSDINKGATYVGGKVKENVYKVPDSSYFVVGDNRAASTDSRTCFSSCSTKKSNYIRKDDIAGKVLLDLGYFNFRKFSFTHPELGISTFPKFFSSADSYDYIAE